MTRLILVAGVAAFAIATPTIAGPRDKDRDNNQAQEKKQAQDAKHGQDKAQGGGRAAAAERNHSDASAERRVERQAEAPSMQRERQQQAQDRAAQQQQVRAERQQAQDRGAQQQQVRAERQQQVQTRMEQQRQQRADRQQAQQQLQSNRQQAQTLKAEQAQTRNAQQAQARNAQQEQLRANRQQEVHARVAQQQLRAGRQQQAQARGAQQQQIQADRQQQAQARMAQQQQMRANRQQEAQARMAQQQQLQSNRQQRQVQMVQKVQSNGNAVGVNTGVDAHGGDLRVTRQQQVQALRSANPQIFKASRIQMLASRTQIVAPTQAVKYIGQPVSTVTNYVPLAALPRSASYLYPNTPDYYYQYGGGYLYQVDRSSSLINALIPLLAGGFLPGTYLPSSYMSSYVPDYYGLNSFYPSSYGGGYPSGYGDGYGGYGQGYPTLCNRYAYGVVYQVDCNTGMVINVIPTYAGGYGVGQMLPSASSYYNVPMQYRSMYYPTADYSYWYAPGAIYQYDTSSDLITSVAALMAPGFTVGQPLPSGYGMYNVPMSYRSTYYDTPDASYRYNNGYIYQVNPATQVVTAIVASLLS